MKKEQQAQEYAEKKLQEIPHRIDAFFNPFDIAQAYSDGYTAAEQSLWRSVEDELPEDGQKILIREYYRSAKSGRFVNHVKEYIYFAEYGFELEGKKYSCLRYRITHWMPIPPIPDTNTEKK